MEKRGKNEFWRRREAFAREIERDTKEKSEQVAQRLAQAVRADCLLYTSRPAGGY